MIPTFSDQLSRLNKVVSLLKRRPLRAVQLAAKLQVSRRTAIRLLNMIGSKSVPWVKLRVENRLAKTGRTERYYSIS